MYKITQYSYDKLDELNKNIGNPVYFIKPSINKKIRVYRFNKLVADIGGKKEDGTFYLDYPNYIIKDGLEIANERRRLYYERHKNEPDIKDGEVTPAWFAKWFLW